MPSEVVVTFNEFASAGADSGVKAAIITTAVQVRAEAVAKAPVDFGALKNSIMWRKGWESDAFNFPREDGFNKGGGSKLSTDPLTDQPSRDEAIVGTAIEYGVYQEFGTRFMPAQPYLRPAGDAVRGAPASDIIKRYGNEAMSREFQRRKSTTRRTP